jgi:hypothetical protein
MKISRLLLLLVASSLANCAIHAKDDYVFPSGAFDAAQAAAQLEPGTSTIRGIALAKEMDTSFTGINLSTGHRAWSGTLVTLFPRTPYLEEWLKLRKKHGNRAVLSNQVFCHRVITRVTAKGEFEFTDLKPGKYYIEAIVNYVQKTATDVQTGTSSLVNGGGQVISSAPIYTTVYGSYSASRLATAFVQIEADGRVVEVKLRN